MTGGGGGSRQNNSRGGGGGETVLVPTRFVWAHGGRRVFMCGTFTRWAYHIPISPMEGCPTIFQVLYNLTPGFHQVDLIKNKFGLDDVFNH